MRGQQNWLLDLAGGHLYEVPSNSVNAGVNLTHWVNFRLARTVDPIETARRLFPVAMRNAGQICLAAKRIFVPASMYDVFCNELARLADATIVGDGLDPATTMGPIQNKAQYHRALGYLEDARTSGTIIAGGVPVPGPGYFIRPTIVRDIPDSARLVREEQFCPVLPVLSYDDLDDAIQRANATDYGLSATVWGRDIERAFEVAMRIEAGTVWINKHLVIDPGVTARGAKLSGLGGELGPEGGPKKMWLVHNRAGAATTGPIASKV